MSYRLARTAHFLTIDVTGWHRDPVVAQALRNGVAGSFAARDESVVDRVVDELAAADARATFFVDATVAVAAKTLARRLVGAGHEVGVLGTYDGDDWDEFRDDARSGRAVLEDQTGLQVRGFRSPSGARNGGPWRFDVLVEESFEYDSSRTAGYIQSFVCGSGTLIEVPLTPGTALRYSTYAQLRGVLESRTRAAMPSVVAFSTWEMDVDQPKVRLPMLASIRHYGGRRAAGDRLHRMLTDFRFDAIAHRLTDLSQSAPQTFAA